MLNVPRLLSVCSLFLCLLAGVAGSSSFAQTPDQTPLDRQLARIDFGVVGVGMFTKDVSGIAQINAQPTVVTLQSSTTLGALVTLRYVKSPWVGFEGNFGYSRYTQNFSNPRRRPEHRPRVHPRLHRPHPRHPRRASLHRRRSRHH